MGVSPVVLLGGVKFSSGSNLLLLINIWMTSLRRKYLQNRILKFTNAIHPIIP